MFENSKKEINENIVPGKNAGTSATGLKETLLAVLDDARDAISDANFGIIGAITTSQELSVLNSLPDGVYEAQTSGLYKNGLTAKEGYYTRFRKTANTWSLESETKIPAYDDTDLKQRVLDNETKVDEFIENFAVDVDQEFDENSENAISNKKVSQIKNAINSFVSNSESLGFVTIPSFTSGIVNKSGVIETNINHQYIKIKLSNVDYIHYKGFRLVFTADSDVLNYKHILGKRTDGSYISMSEALKVSSVNQQNYDIILNTSGITEIYINKLNTVAHNITIEKFRGKYDLDSVKTYIDNVSDLDYQIQDKLNYNPLEIEESPINSETIGIDLNNLSVSTVYGIFANNIKTNGSGKITEIRFKSSLEHRSRLFLLCKIINGKAKLLNWSYATDIVIGVNSFKPRNWYCEKDCVVFTGTSNLLYSDSGNGIGYIKLNTLTFELNDEQNIITHPSIPNGYIALEFDVDYTSQSPQEVPTFKNQVLDKLNNDFRNPLNINYYSVNNVLKGGAITFIDDDTPNRVLDELVPLFINNNTPLGLAVFRNNINHTLWVSHLKTYHSKYGDLIEMLNHTLSHRATHNTDNYTKQLEEIKGCDNWLKSLGINVSGYVSPYGRFNQTTLDIINELGYTHHYRFDYEKETNSSDDFFNLGIKRINFGSNWSGFPTSATLAETKALIDQAIANNEWLVITLHYTNSNVSTWWADVKELIRYCKEKNARVLKPSDGFELFRNIIEVDNGFRITKNGGIKTEHIPYSYR